MSASQVCMAISMAMLLYAWFVFRRARASLADARRIFEQAKELNDRSMEAGAVYEAALKKASSVHDVVVAASAREKKRADDYFSIIEGIEGEAQTWRNLYRRDMAGGNAAQAWLMRELNTAVMQGNRYAKELQARGVAVRDISVSDELKDVVMQLAEKGEVLPKQVRVAPGKAAASVIEENYRSEEPGNG